MKPLNASNSLVRISLDGHGRETMPKYEYVCHQCHKSFTLELSMAEHDKRHVTCPKCKSRKVEQKLSAFAAVTSRKS